jgi:hypothetical protein
MTQTTQTTSPTTAQAQTTKPQLTDDMTLEEKLDAIEQALLAAQQVAIDQAAASGTPVIMPDPAELTMCEGCQ